MLYTLKNSAFYGCASPFTWIYLNRACSCFLSVAAVSTRKKPISARGADLVFNQHHSPTLAVNEMPIAVSLVNLKRKESAGKEELVFMMIPERGYLGKKRATNHPHPPRRH